MAKGDLTVFEEFALDIGSKLHQLDTDTHKLALIQTAAETGAVVATNASPTWGDFSAAEVASGNGYATGGETVASTALTEAAGVAKFDGADVTWSQNASGFTNARSAILYSSTATSSNAICYVDLGSSNVSLQDGDITVAWNASGILTITVS
ncbi:unnamed protein product [marine sediment metagenome]|uniref:Uncharacterized protein n=1 Tax=marine sediment metagenome TaxID=412755 RepID=X0RIW8_9ZZZZ